MHASLGPFWVAHSAVSTDCLLHFRSNVHEADDAHEIRIEDEAACAIGHAQSFVLRRAKRRTARDRWHTRLRLQCGSRVRHPLHGHWNESVADSPLIQQNERPKMALSWHAFAVPKRGNSTEEYEDAFAANPNAGRFAIADGASESSFASLWAKLL